jgi:hypothetical protein
MEKTYTFSDIKHSVVDRINEILSTEELIIDYDYTSKNLDDPNYKVTMFNGDYSICKVFEFTNTDKLPEVKYTIKTYVNGICTNTTCHSWYNVGNDKYSDSKDAYNVYANKVLGFNNSKNYAQNLADMLADHITSCFRGGF